MTQPTIDAAVFDLAATLATLDEAYLRRRARELDVDEETLRLAMREPCVALTCPLCGEANSHLINCGGCGPDAWGDEFELLHGERAVETLRSALAESLNQDGSRDEAVTYAVGHAFVRRGCRLCPDCWTALRPCGQSLTCPLRLLAQRQLEGPGCVPEGFLLALVHGKNEAEWHEGLREAWRQAEGNWRERILEAAVSAQQSAVRHQSSGISRQKRLTIED